MTEPTKQQMLACLDGIINARRDNIRYIDKNDRDAIAAFDLDIAVLSRCKVLIGETMPEVIAAPCPSCSDINAKERHLDSLRDRTSTDAGMMAITAHCEEQMAMEDRVGEEAVQRSH